MPFLNNIFKVETWSIAADFNHIAYPLSHPTEEQLAYQEPALPDRIGGGFLFALSMLLVIPACFYLYWAGKKVEQIDILRSQSAEDKTNRTAQSSSVFISGTKTETETKAKETTEIKEKIEGSPTPNAPYENTIATPISSSSSTFPSPATPELTQTPTTHSPPSLHTVSAPEFSSTEKSQTSYKGFITIHPVNTGYYGKRKQQYFLPKYLRRITLELEDGSPLRHIAPDDIAIELKVYNTSPELKALPFPPSNVFYLPASLLANKNDGDIIRLKYNKHLIELTIGQIPNTLRDTPQEFTPLVNAIVRHAKTETDIEYPLFDYPHYWWYYLGDQGSLFHLFTKKEEKNSSEPTLVLKELDKEALRSLEQPEEISLYDMYGTKDSHTFRIPFVRFDPDDIDLILNEKHLIFYGKFENRPLLPESQGPFELVRQDLPKRTNSRGELVLAFRWDRHPLFNNITIGQMKEMLFKSTVTFEGGILTVTLPKCNPLEHS